MCKYRPPVFHDGQLLQKMQQLLLIAESLPEQKELMVRLVEHFVLLKQL